ncbi:enoyl-CoA hydratase/isomerase family protein [Nocardioides mesophilus]|uniref:Enoyl-CoA hydratase/isomerase family protein n=1 Tax=Nocardioides mesophilus TaxID=433659 RepID=A0A7G9R9T3_9ACTN|nr:enoyl-CoA hydratase/isomerase family protein [Nocardioides mesophilus]QNN52358.1 enoyl-CoA hydratase/isomerase family protein [Nocardioides mesophilus]
MSDLILVDQHGAVRWLTLNRPEKLNALSHDMVGELSAALTAAEKDESTKVVVLSGSGRAFCAGFDLTEEAGEGIEGADTWHDILRRDIDVTMQLWSLSKPTVAAVHGWCLAGGCDLAMACDMVIASSDARFGEPEIRYGSGPATMLMPFVLGEKKTNELLFTGDSLSAAEAERIGLVNHVVDDHDLRSAIDALCAKITPTPAGTLRYTKLALTRAYEAMGLRTAVSANHDLSAILNSLDSPEQQAFDERVRTQGLRSALAWRDARYAPPPAPSDLDRSPEP